jgi:hypothetical protein
MGTCTICGETTDLGTACAPCLDRLYDCLRSIVIEYRRLDPNPTGVADSGRRAPGFRSQSPANDHVIALRDRRTRARVHGDLQNAHTFMADWVAYVQRERGMALSSSLSIEAAYYALYSHQDYIGRQGWVSELAMGAATVLGQLRTANGDKPPTRLGSCTQCEGGSLTLVGGFVRCGSCPFRVSATELLDQYYDLGSTYDDAAA